MIVIMLSVSICLVSAGCSSGVPQSEYDALSSENVALTSKNEELQSQVDSLIEENEILNAATDTLKNQLQKNGDSNNTSSQKSASASESSSFSPNDENTLVSKLEVKEYSYSSEYWNYAFLAIKNNSDYNLAISTDVKFYDESGNLVGAKSADQEAVEKGYSTILYFMPDEKFEKMEYDITAKVEKRFNCVLSDLSYEDTVAQNKIILTVTNNGDEAARFAQASVLFFNGDKVVGFAQKFVTDDDSELKPGKSISKEMNCYEDFDTYQVFFSGRR